MENNVSVHHPIAPTKEATAATRGHPNLIITLPPKYISMMI